MALEKLNKDQTNLDRLQIVLVDTETDENIGSVCRAMKTMGLSRLAIVSNSRYHEDSIRKLAIHAFDIYEQHKRYSTLSEAVSDSILTIGATRRRGKFRKYFSYLPEQLTEKINSLGPGVVSIVFGRESDGLTLEELSICDAAVRIPTSKDFPSLNLAQAVQIIAYELRRGLTDTDGYRPIERIQLEKTVDTVIESLESIDFFKQQEKLEVRQFYRDIFARAGLSKQESDRIEKHFRKMAAIKIYK